MNVSALQTVPSPFGDLEPFSKLPKGSEVKDERG